VAANSADSGTQTLAIDMIARYCSYFSEDKETVLNISNAYVNLVDEMNLKVFAVLFSLIYSFLWAFCR
jgi:hypothetical protein